ncbi:MAG: hypothetical protein WCF85_05365 [Rhodospirillaceae bacterium]
MSIPARKLPTAPQTDPAAILAAINELGERMERRFAKVETALAKVETTVTKVETAIVKVEADVTEVKAAQKDQGKDIYKIQLDLARLDGRVSLIPNLIQVAGLVFVIFSASFVLIRVASGH